MQVDVCIATFKRPLLLKILLESLVGQVLSNSVLLRIVVVDNDAEKSALQIVDNFKVNSDIPICYDCEPEQNIALTRNRALANVQGKYLAFIDDDECAAPDWLQHLLDTANTQQADVVFGPVLPMHSEGTRYWIKKGRFFERQRYPTGTKLIHGATSNVLIKKEILDCNNMVFDAAYGLTGGEDTDFFLRLNNTGAQMVWCDEALVHEVVPIERARMAWILRRAFRGGQVFARVFIPRMTIPDKGVWLFKRIASLLLYAPLQPFLWLFGIHWGVWGLKKIIADIGQLTGNTKYRYREYSGGTKK